MTEREGPRRGFSASFPALRDLLAIRPFRTLFIAGSLSSFGDWLALLATTALAAALADGGAGQYFAVSGVFILRIAPAIVLGPLAGVVADRLDRRKTMVVGDVLRFGLFVTIPLSASCGGCTSRSCSSSASRSSGTPPRTPRSPTSCRPTASSWPTS